MSIWPAGILNPLNCKDDKSIFKAEGFSCGEFVKLFNKLNEEKLRAEFGELPTKLAGPAAEYLRAREKNRYKEIPCLDTTRVQLNDGLPGDFINASFVDSFYQTKGYILAMAPCDKSEVDWWRMIWQEKVYIIVCLTPIWENGKPKCTTTGRRRSGALAGTGPS